MASLDMLLAAPRPWEVLQQLVESPPDDILAAVEEHFARATDDEKHLLIQLVAQLRGPGADQVLAGWLRTAGAENEAEVLRAITRRGGRVDRADLVRLLAARDPGTRVAAVAAAGASGDASLAPLVAQRLDDAPAAMHAAMALGRLRAEQYTTTLLRRLPKLRGMVQPGFLVALELMGDERAIGPLREWLPRAPEDLTWDIHHALSVLSGREPVIAPAGSREDGARAIRKAWSRFDVSRPAAPRFERIEQRDAAEIAFELHDSTGRVRIEYDAPPPGSQWPRWSKSLRIGGHPIYDVGSDCGTCETCLRLLGWPEDRAALHAESVRRALADVASVNPTLLETLTPLLGALRPGHYLVRLANLDVELVTGAASSWWQRRGERRRGAESDGPEVGCDWPGTAHYQLREPISGTPPTFGVLLPSQDPSRLSPEVVGAHEVTIRDGARPACVALAWIEDKYVHAEHPERFLVGVVLDGHHKLAAYARRGTPARALMVCRIEDTWGPAGERERWFREATKALAVRCPG